METIIDRIILIAQKKGLTNRQFTIEVDFSYETFNNYKLGKRTSIDINLIVKTLKKFPEFSARWLLIGDVEMHDTSTSIPPNALNVAKDLGGFEKELLKQYTEKVEENALLKEKIKVFEQSKPLLIAADPTIKYKVKKISE